MTRQELLAIAKPMLFNTEMMRANLDERKTETRRVIKPKPQWVEQHPKYRAIPSGWWFRENIRGIEDANHFAKIIVDAFAPYKAGDIIYARETWCESLGVAKKYFYKAYAGEIDADKEYCHSFNKWRPSIHMPKEAARWFARVKSVHVERVQDIDASHCIREGVTWKEYPNAWTVMAKPAFAELWDSTLKPAELPLYGWAANPWVWVIAYEHIAPE